MPSELIFITGFIIIIVALLAADLGFFANPNKAVSAGRAAIMSAVWIALALGFYAGLYRYGNLLHNVTTFAGLQRINRQNFHHLVLDPNNIAGSLQLYRKSLSLEFISGYVVEYALSVDNIFVMVLIFTAFGVHSRHYHKVLFWGILGAIIMRMAFIFAGAALIARFHWVLYVFGIFLVYTGVVMFINRNEEKKIDPKNHKIVRLASKYFAVYPEFAGGKFFVKLDHKKYITPLFLVLLIIEGTDVLFAVDSIPAIFSITKDPYIVFFSNIFAILGLRSMFFLLVNIIDRFRFLKVGLAVLLGFIGLKMLAGNYVERIGLDTGKSLLVILTILVISVCASLLFPAKTNQV